VVKIKGNWSNLIAPSALPALESVAIAFGDTTSSSHELESLAASLITVAPQLRSFSLRDPYERISIYLLPNIAAFTALDSLTVQCRRRPSSSAYPSFLRRALYDLPSPLWQLRIVAPSSPSSSAEDWRANGLLDDLRTLADALREEEGVPSTSLLSRVIVPSPGNSYEARVSRLEELYGELEDVARSRECKLERAPKEHAEFGDWETFLDEW